MRAVGIDLDDGVVPAGEGVGEALQVSGAEPGLLRPVQHRYPGVEGGELVADASGAVG